MNWSISSYRQFQKALEMNLNEVKDIFSNHVKNLQNQITRELKAIDESIELNEDNWKRKDYLGNDGGGGITRSFTGNIIENAGVNTSLVHGALSPDFASKLHGSGADLWATGLSLIIHPRNPRVPTVHANFRLIHQGDKFWFGGGADLTPYYPYPEDFKAFHQTLKNASLNADHYYEMKKTCDEYFVNHHRESEMRGIGGIFFDHHNSGDIEKDLEMVKKLSESFIPAYFPIVKKRVSEEYSKEEENFQLMRRGRYVEFNLLHDRGTLFGLKSNGRTKSILISLPARCNFHYNFQLKTDSVLNEMNDYYFPKKWC